LKQLLDCSALYRFIGAIIGRNGANIKDMIAKCSANIYISKVLNAANMGWDFKMIVIAVVVVAAVVVGVRVGVGVGVVVVLLVVVVVTVLTL
jgi:hypothetical protein